MVSYIPCDALQPYIQSLMVTESLEAQSYTVLPGTSLVMGFQFSGSLAYRNNAIAINLATAGITGILNGFRVFENTANTGTVLVIFKESGAIHFFKEPLHELYNESLSLEYFVKHDELVSFQEKLSLAQDAASRIKLVEGFLLSRLNRRKTDLLVIEAIRQIHLHQGNMRMSDLARMLQISKSPLEKRFRQAVGATPKKFSTITRMKSMLIAMQSPVYENNEYQIGFYDQAHFIHDFKNFTGETPKQYLKRLIAEK